MQKIKKDQPVIKEQEPELSLKMQRFDRPTVSIKGQDSRISDIVYSSSKALKKAGLSRFISQMEERCSDADDEKALEILNEYVIIDYD